MMRRRERWAQVVWPGRCGRMGIVCLLMMTLMGCVTQTTHSVYTKKVTKGGAIQSRVDAAMEYLRKGDTENAIRHLREAHQINKRSAPVNHGLALAFQMSGERELAEQHFKAALKADGNFTSARNNYSVFLYRNQRYAEACRQMRRVIDDTLYPGRGAAFHNLGQCENRLGHAEAAQEAFQRALALNRSHTGSMLELAAIHLDQGNYSQAQRYYQSYDERAEQTARSLYLGIQLAQEFGEADTQASFALALKNRFPDSAEYLRYKNNLDDKDRGNDTTK